MSRTSPVTSRIMNRLFLATATLSAAAFGFTMSVAAQENDEQDASEADRTTAERCSAPEFRQFDFWLGTWEVRNPDGELIGHNEIQRVSGGCGLLESWESAGGGTGVSINTYDTERARWTQRWVGSGATLWLEGSLEEGSDGARMVLTGTEPRSTLHAEVKVRDRISWTPLPDGRVLQLWEIQPVTEEDWREAFRGLYTRVSSEARDAAAVKAADQAYAEAWLANDPDAVMATLTRDAVIVPSGMEPFEGPEAIRAFWFPPDSPATTVKEYRLDQDEVAASADLAYVRGSFTLAFDYDGDSYQNEGSYFSLLRRNDDGGWRISRRTWNDHQRD